MRSHPDYHARLLPFELGFRGTQWLKAMDYEGLPKESLQNDPPHQVAGRVCVFVGVWERTQVSICVLSTLQKEIIFHKLILIENLVISGE